MVRGLGGHFNAKSCQEEGERAAAQASFILGTGPRAAHGRAMVRIVPATAHGVGVSGSCRLHPVGQG
jgi:hypothetical protein